MAGKTPHGSFHPKILFEIAGPDQRALFRVEANQVPFRPERIDFPVVNRRCGARTRGIAHGVGAFVFVLPKNFSICLVQAEHAFAAGDFAARKSIRRVGRAFGELAVHDIDAAFRHGGTGVAAPNGNAPAILQTGCGKFLDDATLAPDRVALRAEPLRPIVGAKHGHGE